MQDEQEVKKPKAKKDLSAEPGNATRMSAGKRRAEAAKPKEEEPAAVEVKVEGDIPAPEEAKAEETPAPAPELPAEEEKTEPAAEAEAEKTMGEEPEHKEEPKTAIEQFAAEESKEPQHAQKYEPVGEYTPPETGASHEEHLDAYHNALMYGDAEGAKQHYGALREHQYAEDTHRRRAEDQEKQQGDEYEQAAHEVHAAYPHLNLHEDNVESDKIMALAHVYQSHGEAPGAALRKAAHELHGAKPAPAEQGFSVGGIVNSAEVPKAKEESDSSEADKVNSTEVLPAAQESDNPAAEIVNNSPLPKEKEQPLIPDMADRNLRKKQIADVPAANAKQEAEKPQEKKPESREEAIARMKAARNQK